MRRRLMGNSKLKATLVQHLDTQGGEVVFYDIESNAFLYYRLDDGEDIVPKTCVPIGFVAIPGSENFYEDYACGVMSLCYMSCSSIEGSKDNEPMMWGNDAILINADDNTNGKINTQKIIEARGALEGLPNPSLAADYPAASICNMYYTEGTKAGDWYLPAITELAIAFLFLRDLPDVIKKLKKFYSSYKIMNDGLYRVWSSTEYGEQYARWIDLILDDYVGKTAEIGAVAFTQMGALERNYGDIFISGGTVSDIPASGGSSQVTGYTYSQTYGYGDSTINGGTIASGAEISVTSISGDNLGNTETERTKKGESVLTITMNGKTASKSYDVYQEANVKSVSGTSGGAYSYGNISAGSISNATIGAGGGSATAYAGNGSQSWSRTAITTSYSYTSGATSSAVTTAASSGTNSVAPSASSYTASANSKGTSVSGVTTVGSKYITWSANGKSTGGTMYVYQAANAIVSRTWLNGTPQFNVQTTISNLSGSYVLTGNGDCAAGTQHQIKCHYSTTCSFTITFKALAKATFTSGSTGPVELTSYNQNINSNDSIGLTVTGSYPTYNCTLRSLSEGKNFASEVFNANICFSNTCRGSYMLKIFRSKY